MKSLISYIQEKWEPVRKNNWNYNSGGIYLFYMVKYQSYKYGEQWSYNMSEPIKYDPEITEQCGYRNLEAFKKFVFSCFLRQRDEIIKDYESYGADVKVICKPEWIMCPWKDDLKKWQSNTFNDCNKMVNAHSTTKLKGGYERYEAKYDKLCQERRERWEEEARKRREEDMRKQKEYEEWKEQFMKDHAGDSYYTYYGWPWQRRGNWVGD